MPFIPNSDEDRREMMDALGIKSVEELFSEIPDDVRVKDDWSRFTGKSESSALKFLSSLAEKNINAENCSSFLGGGAYDHFIPSIVKHASGRSEFYTAYTPYQPEVSQGTLQAIYEYQTMICELTGMDVSNASMYDGVTSTAEAVLLTTSSLKKNKILIPENLPENYKQVLGTYGHGRNIAFEPVPCPDGLIDKDALRKMAGADTAGLVVQYPNYFGLIEPLEELATIIHESGGYLIVSVNPMTLALLRTPGECGADIVTGDGQVFGNEMNCGGPYLGIFAAKKNLVRKMPGRLSGRTIDTEGRQGFVLTLQTREQHIRREKATSNICTNQGLMMLRSAIYLETMGKEGLCDVARQCTLKAHYLAEQIGGLEGFAIKYSGPFFHEFVVTCPVDAREICDKLIEDKIFAGIPLDDMGDKNALLVCVTEKRTREEMDNYVKKLRQFSNENDNEKPLIWRI